MRYWVDTLTSIGTMTLLAMETEEGLLVGYLDGDPLYADEDAIIYVEEVEEDI